MDHEEINREMGMDYHSLVDYLLKKYGKAKYDYFTNDTCKYKNRNVVRIKEGLFCHHIDEDKFQDLSNPYSAKRKSFDLQKKERLVYCNYLEHLILHCKICIMNMEKTDNASQILLHVTPGMEFLTNGINSLWRQHSYSMDEENDIVFRLIEDNREDYLLILCTYLDAVEKSYIGKEKNPALVIGIEVDVCEDVSWWWGELKAGKYKIVDIRSDYEAFLLESEEGKAFVVGSYELVESLNNACTAYDIVLLIMNRFSYVNKTFLPEIFDELKNAYQVFKSK